MQTVDYSRVLSATANYLGVAADSLNRAQQAVVQSAISQALEKAWKWCFWPELMRTEQRWFYPLISVNDNYVAGDIRYYGPEDKYYQLLFATAAGTTIITDPQYWGELKPKYGGSEWDENTNYAQGDTAYYYDLTTGSTPAKIFTQAIVANQNVSPSLGNPTWSAAPLVEWVRTIDYEQTGYAVIDRDGVMGVWRDDPRKFSGTPPARYELTRDGITIYSNWTSVWVVFKQHFVALDGEQYSATATYGVGEQVLFTDSDGIANFYDCVTATAAGESPETDPDKWAVVEIPAIFLRYLAMGAYAIWLKGDGQTERGTVIEAQADGLLTELEARLVAMNGQTLRTVVLTR